jgi:hypothetical protein
MRFSRWRCAYRSADEWVCPMFMYVAIAVVAVGGVWFIYQLWKDDVASRKR